MRTEPFQITGVGLARGDVLRLENARDTQVRVDHGALWITQERDAKDVYLARGESFRLDRDGTAVLSACGHAPRTLISLTPAS
jgi:Protein of unknown function (DUF2917)